MIFVKYSRFFMGQLTTYICGVLKNLKNCLHTTSQTYSNLHFNEGTSSNNLYYVGTPQT